MLYLILMGAKAQIWIDCLKKRVGNPVNLSDGSGVQMKMEQFKIPLVSCYTKKDYGSLSVTVYPSPKSSHPKIMVQGQMHMAFVSFILPDIIKDMQSGASLPISYVGPDSQVPDSDEEIDDGSHDSVAIYHLHQAFKRMEQEMLGIRTILVAKVDTALENITTQNNSNLEDRLESLESLIKKNIEQQTELSRGITELTSTIKNKDMGGNINLETSQIDKLATSVSNHPSLLQLSTTLNAIRIEVAQATSLQVVQSEVHSMLDNVTNMQNNFSLLEGHVKEVSKKISENNDASNREMTQLRKNSDDSLGMFEAMKKSLETLVQQTAHPAVPSTSQSTTQSPPTTQPIATPDTPCTRQRRGIMFSSSLALDIDTKRFNDDLNCDLKIIPTYYIEQHSEAQDPDAYLQCMINKHLLGKSGYDFAIFATGTNDISTLDTVNSPPTTLMNSVADQTKIMVELAETLTTEMNIDVFIVEKPPRYDPPTKDPTVMLNKLTKFSNGSLASYVGMSPRIFIVDQAGLVRSGVKSRADIYKPDGLHLTTKGLLFYTTNIISSLQSCYGDTLLLKKAKHMTPTPGQDGRGYQGNYGKGRGDRTYGDHGQGGYSGRGDQRDHRPQDRQGYGGHPSDRYYYQPPHPPQTGLGW